MYEQPTAQDMQHVRDSIFKFIEDEDAEMEVHSLTHTRVIMAEMRRMIIEGKEVGGGTTIMRTPRREEEDGGEERGGKEPVGINPLFSGGNVNVEEKVSNFTLRVRSYVSLFTRRRRCSVLQATRTLLGRRCGAEKRGSRHHGAALA